MTRPELRVWARCFLRQVERGKATVQLGRVMQLLAELGIELKAEVPDGVMPEFRRLAAVGVKPLPPRRSTKKTNAGSRFRDPEGSV